MFFTDFPELTMVDKNIKSTDYIFKRMFLVRVPREAIINQEEIERLGSRSTGFRKYDEQLVGSFTQVYLPISKIADIAYDGYQISLCNPSEDARRMYEYIQYHLESWMQVLNNSMHQIKAPIEDLKKLDNLANNVYAVAAGYYDRENPQTEFDKFLQSMQLGVMFPSMDTLYEEDLKPSNEVKTQTLNPRKSFQDDLLEYQARLMGG